MCVGFVTSSPREHSTGLVSGTFSSVPHWSSQSCVHTVEEGNRGAGVALNGSEPFRPAMDIVVTRLEPKHSSRAHMSYTYELNIKLH